MLLDVPGGAAVPPAGRGEDRGQPRRGEFVVSRPGQSRRPRPEGAGRLFPDTVEEGTECARRQVGEAEQPESLGARFHQFRQPSRPPLGRRFFDAASEHRRRGFVSAETGIERISSRQPVIEACQCLLGPAPQGDAAQHDVDEQGEARLFAGLTQGLDQILGRSRPRECRDRASMIECEKRIAPGAKVEDRAGADMIEARLRGVHDGGFTSVEGIEGSQIEVQHLHRAPLHGGRHDGRPRCRTLPHGNETRRLRRGSPIRPPPGFRSARHCT